MPRPSQNITAENVSSLAEQLEDTLAMLKAANRKMEHHLDLTVVPTFEQLRTVTEVAMELSTFIYRATLLHSHIELRASTEAQVRADLEKSSR